MGNSFCFRARIASAAVVVALAAAVDAVAQEKHKFFFKPPPNSTRYTQTHLMDVDDVPGHQVRMAELLSKYAGDGPVYDGVKVVSARGVLVSDYTDGSGRAFSYTVQTLESGDKVFLRTEIMSHSSTGADGARRTSFSSVATLSGGTGRFKGIRGTLRGTGATDLKTGTSGTQTEGEYWFEK
jgi:hypothetical protein